MRPLAGTEVVPELGCDRLRVLGTKVPQQLSKAVAVLKKIAAPSIDGDNVIPDVVAKGKLKLCLWNSFKPLHDSDVSQPCRNRTGHGYCAPTCEHPCYLQVNLLTSTVQANAAVASDLASRVARCKCGEVGFTLHVSET